MNLSPGGRDASGVFYLELSMDRNEKAASIHEDMIKAGWWQQVREQIDGYVTGNTRTVGRNIGELLCLVHSEISEAWLGNATNSMDDHLPHLPMFQVEIADTAIRTYDILGYYNSLDGCATFTPSEIFDFPYEMKPDNYMKLGVCHCLISDAMEAFRKGYTLKAKMCLNFLLDCLEQIAEEDHFDLDDIIEQKREYNRNRADHKLENRTKTDGKRF